ncbi:MAG: rod shape-determining protein MreD [Faecalibacterium sp.]|nr:rod shape-determining protein MreD [Faecalibacterium sp.]
MNPYFRQERPLWLKWAIYSLFLLLGLVLQTLPTAGLFGIKPLFILPLCLIVSLVEGEYEGALFGAVGGLLWDWAAGRTVGLLTILLLAVCFLASVLFQVYLRNTAGNFGMLAALAALLVLSLDHLFFYVMPGYPSAAQHWLREVLPLAVLCFPVGLVARWVVLKVHLAFHPEEQ